jgi:poly-beta-1,6-N-acetyl-D-glucosamine synthase
MDWHFPEAYHWSWLLFGGFALSAVVQMFYHWYYFRRVAFGNPAAGENGLPPVSVVICARNEYLNLEKNLPLILEQEYPDFEVLVVNDGSDDDSELLLQDMRSQFPHLKVVNLRPNVNFFQGKKFPLSMGIKSATHEHLLLTDADCRPAGRHWIRKMARHFSGPTEIVLGYSPYETLPGLLNRLIRFDTLLVGLQYLGMAMAGRPYMGVGRNLAYKRELFYRHKGFTSHYKVMSGDDDLFVNQAATSNNLAVEFTPDSHTLSAPKKSFSGWFRQKRRHLTTGRYYKQGNKWRLGLFGMSQLLFYGLLLALLIVFPSPALILTALGVFLLRTISLMLIVNYAGKRLNEAKLFLYSPVLDAALTLLNVIFSLSALFHKQSKWK